jgi:hypothetical protein
MSTEQIIVNDVAIQTSVAPIEVPPVEVAVKQTKEKKPKKVSDTPKLAPRFQKFIDFGLWVALQLKNKNLINDEVFQTILTDIKMNDQVDVQTEFYTNYEKSGKPTVSPDAPSLSADGEEVKPKAKRSRKPTGRDSTPDAPSLSADGEEVKPKAKRVRKPKVVASDANEVVPVEEKPKAKKARKPKVVASDTTEPGLVQDSEAVPVEGVPVEGVPVEEKPKAKKARKPKVVASDATETGLVEGVPVEGVPVEGVPVEEKPKAKKARKPKVVSSDATETQIIQSIPVEGITGEDKPKAKKSRKPKASSPLSNSNDIIHDLLSHAISSSSIEAQNEKPTVEIQNDNDNSEDEDVSVSTIIINNEEYLIDDHFNLYHTITHDNIGTFINEQLELRTSYELTRAA